METDHTDTTVTDGIKGPVIGAVDVNKINVRKHVGTYSTIEEIKEKEGNWGPYLILKTAVIEEIPTSSGTVQLRASKLFNLRRNALGQVYWVKGSKFDQYLTQHHCTHWKDLMGARVQLTPVLNPKNGREYLSFS